MGKRGRRRARSGGAAPEATTTDYADAQGDVLTLRDRLSAASQAKIAAGDGTEAASQDDVWQRRTEMLFERYAVRWEIAGLPLESQKELLGRLRMADSDTRRWVRETIDRHMEANT